MLCAACLKKRVAAGSGRGFRVASLGVAGLCGLGVLTGWLFFFCVGRALLAVPASFHEGTVWEGSVMDEP